MVRNYNDLRLLLIIAGAVIVPLLTALTALTAKLGGIKYALWVLAGGLVVMFIINCVAFKNYPEEWNAFPDNDPNAQRIPLPDSRPVRGPHRQLQHWLGHFRRDGSDWRRPVLLY